MKAAAGAVYGAGVHAVRIKRATETTPLPTVFLRPRRASMAFALEATWFNIRKAW